MSGIMVKSLSKVTNSKRKKGILHRLQTFFGFDIQKNHSSNPPMVKDYTIETKEENIVQKRRIEISKFSHELKEFGLDFISLTSKKPRKEQEVQLAYFIAETITTHSEISNILLMERALPFTDIMRQVSVKKGFLVKNQAYIVGLSILLLGDYKLLKDYLVEETRN